MPDQFTITPSIFSDPAVAERAREIFRRRESAAHARTDRMFAWLLAFEYVAGIVTAVIVSPRTWSGASSQIHLHVWTAVILGAVIVSLPIWLAVSFPGRMTTRHVIAAGQMLCSALLIHLSGGRIETHFHVFGSLAFLAFYRDWPVLMTASAVVAADHLLRGLFWPQSVYGTLSGGQWRWLEHAGWVVFEVFFLRISCLENVSEMREDALQKAQLELSHLAVEREVAKRTADLERKNKELDEFTYVASHDLQEPVRKLISFSKLLEQDAGANLEERAKKDLSFIVDAAARMRDLIQDLLALSRAGRAAMKVEPISLANCVDSALDALEMRVLETHAEIDRDELPEIAGDAVLMTQLYQNLVGNALKFIPPDRQPKIRITANRRGDEWELAVADNGIGIKPEHVDRLFRPFQRLHGRGEFEGTGIGLAICKKAVERHGGQIWVESVPGAGSQFKFTIPIAPEKTPCPAQKRTQPASL
jgi:two-component system sensor histidine kinase/response regulator